MKQMLRQFTQFTLKWKSNKRLSKLKKQSRKQASQSQLNRLILMISSMKCQQILDHQLLKIIPRLSSVPQMLQIILKHFSMHLLPRTRKHFSVRQNRILRRFLKLLQLRRRKKIVQLLRSSLTFQLNLKHLLLSKTKGGLWELLDSLRCPTMPTLLLKSNQKSPSQSSQK